MRELANVLYGWLSTVGSVAWKVLWESDETRAALIAVLASIVFAVIKGAYDRRQDRIRASAALWHETLRLADYVAAVGSHLNIRVRTRWMSSAEEIARFGPPEPIVFPVLANHLLLLDPMTVQQLVAFQLNLRRARELTSALPERPTLDRTNMEYPEGAKVTTQRASEAWQRAAFHGAEVIKRLKGSVLGGQLARWRHSVLGSEEWDLAEYADKLARMLSEVSEGKSPSAEDQRFGAPGA